MSAKLIRRITEVFIALFVLGAALSVVRSVLSVFSGNFGTVRWPVSLDAPQNTELANGGVVALTHGEIALPGQVAAQLVELATHLTTIGLLVFAMLALRKLLLRFSEGDLIAVDNVVSLRRIGFSLIAVCVISLTHVLVLQPMILGATEMPSGMVLHPSISWSVEGVTNVWLEYDVPVLTLVLGGLSLLFAGAFTMAVDYREDSEGVI